MKYEVIIEVKLQEYYDSNEVIDIVLRFKFKIIKKGNRNKERVDLER